VSPANRDGQSEAQRVKLHDDEVSIDADLVRRLVAEQFPQLSDLAPREFPSTGTVNKIYLLGNELCVRLPRVQRWASSLEQECTWLPILAPSLTLEVPEPVLKAPPTSYYPFSWAIFRWIDGHTYARDRVDDERRAAADLAQFVAELRSNELPPIDDQTPYGGRPPLAEQDADVRSWIAQAGDLIDGPAVTAAWEDALKSPAWHGNYAWIHSDLVPPNLLVKDGRLRAVIDFGATGLGDPATDLNPAWSVFGQAGRGVYRTLVGADDDAWRRGRGIAISQAVGLVPYYVRTNPALSALGRRMLREILADFCHTR
jgi:aminoglycoside phosphotransferase (APT) family kinase protein